MSSNPDKIRFSERLSRIREGIKSLEVEALLVSNRFTRRYLSGFTGSAGYLFITAEDALLATDSRYTEQSADEAEGWEIRNVAGDSKWLTDIAGETSAKRIGFEGFDLTFATYKRIKQRFSESGIQSELVDAGKLTETARAVKDKDDLPAVIEAIKVGDDCFDELAAQLKPGQTEMEIATLFEESARKRGAEAISFDTIVASGPNGSRPHHRPGQRRIAEGEPVVIDCGVRVAGYCSDLTRTVVLGKPDPKLREIHKVVRRAQKTAIENIRSGMTGKEADSLAREVISDAGYGDNFGHSLGHGLGLEVHEAPGVGATSENRLKEGMVFTVEPGIYLPGWGGVRIEDVVMIERGKCRVLSQACLRELG